MKRIARPAYEVSCIEFSLVHCQHADCLKASCMCAVRSQPYLKDFSSSKGPGSGTIEVNPGGVMCPPFVVRYNTVSPSLPLKQAEHLNSIPTAVSGCRAACQTHLSAQHQRSSLQALPVSLHVWDMHSRASNGGAEETTGMPYLVSRQQRETRKNRNMSMN